MTQLIITYIIIGIAVLIAGWKGYKMFSKKRKGKSGCCCDGCDIKKSCP